MPAETHFDVRRLTDAIARVFVAAGLSPTASGTVAEAIVEADKRGISSHGSLLVPMYVDRILAGSVSTCEEATVISDQRTTAVLDGQHGLGMLTGDQAMAMAVAKAQAHGLGAVVVRRAFHFGGGFRFVQAAARSGCIGVAAANTRPLMPAPGGAHAVVGNNPLAFGVPTADGVPLVLDMALSEAALGKIRLAAQEGREIPATWATDANGVPTTDAAAAVAGLLLPAGGHKGYGLALIVDVLTGVLSGGAFGEHVQGLYADTSVPNDCAHFFLALDVAAFCSIAEFEERLAELTEQATRGPLADGVARLFLPGQIEAERAAAAEANGVPLDPSVVEALEDSARKVGVDLDLAGAAA